MYNQRSLHLMSKCLPNKKSQTNIQIFYYHIYIYIYIYTYTAPDLVAFPMGKKPHLVAGLTQWRSVDLPLSLRSQLCCKQCMEHSEIVMPNRLIILLSLCEILMQNLLSLFFLGLLSEAPYFAYISEYAEKLTQWRSLIFR